MMEPAREVRDLVGYGQLPPRVDWPGGARIALSLVLNYEEGSERGPLEGDPVRETSTEAFYETAPGDRELIQESIFEYGSRAGHWRLLRILADFDVTATVFAAGMALERNPAVAAEYARRGYDIVGHGYRWVPHYGMTPAEERLDVRQTREAIRCCTGREMWGWFTRPLPTPETRGILAEEGVSYDCTAVNDDLPYYAIVRGRPFLVVPYSLDVNDVRFWKGNAFGSGEFFEYLRDAFDVLYREGDQRPRMMSVGLHGRISGRPGRAVALQRFLEHVRALPDVWIAGRDDIARHWQRLFGPNDVWNPIPPRQEEVIT